MKSWSVICHRISQMLGLLLTLGWLYVLASPEPWTALVQGVLPIYGLGGVLTAVVYAVDKRAAGQEGAWRIPERVLHQLNFAGGLFGGAVGQWWLRHKNRKPEFMKFYYAAAALHVAVWVLVTALKV